MVIGMIPVHFTHALSATDTQKLNKVQVKWEGGVDSGRSHASLCLFASVCHRHVIITSTRRGAIC